MSSIPQTTTFRQDATFSPETYQKWLEKYPESKQAPTWHAALAEASDQANQVERLLGHLHRGGIYAYYWRPGTTRWYETNRRRPRANATRDTYFGVHPCRFIPQTNAKGEPKPAHLVRSQIGSISAINCVFAEFDDKDYGGRVKTLQHVYSLQPEPSVINDSGGGLHCYWLISEPFFTLTEKDRQRGRSLQARWVEYTGGDPGAKDLARVLRLPGTVNTKYEPARPVTVMSFHLERTYTVEYLESCLPARQERPERAPRSKQRQTPDLERTEATLGRLAPWRCNSYEAWIEVGMALSELGPQGFAMWDRWSAGSTKYGDPGNAELMAYKWNTFTPGDGLTLASLFWWAEQDDPRPAEIREANAREVRLTLSVPEPEPPAELPERVRNCGKLAHAPHEYEWHKRARSHLWCGVTRVCVPCATRKARRLIEDIKARGRGPLYITRVTAEASRSLTRKIGKEHYRRIPLDNDTAILVNDAGIGTEVTQDILDDIDLWVNIVMNTGEGKRHTGHLGEDEQERKKRVARQKGEGEPDVITLRALITDAPEDELDAIYQEAFEAVKDSILHQPAQDATQAERQLRKITREFRLTLIAKGYHVEGISLSRTWQIARYREWLDSIRAIDQVGGKLNGNERLQSPSGEGERPAN